MGCWKPVYGLTYNCKECDLYTHHKSCAKVSLRLHHPLHPILPLILFPPWRYLDNEREFYKCELYKEDRSQYTYRCSCCDFNLQITCASLRPTMEAKFHNHPLTSFWKWITFTCDLCGKEHKGMPYLCNPCGFWIHRKCVVYQA